MVGRLGHAVDAGGPPLVTPDLTFDGRRYTKTFNGDVTNLDATNEITNDYGGSNKWHSYLPYSPGYGGAFLIGPGTLAGLGKAFPAPLFSNGNELAIRAYQALDQNNPGKYHTGILATANRRGEGVTFGIGDYVEAECKMPAGGGKSWPASWAVTEAVDWYVTGVGQVKVRGEIDWFEWYGRAPTSLQVGTATWRLGVGGLVNNGTGLVDLGIDFTAAYHKFGCYLGEDETTFYLDRQELVTYPTHAFHKNHRFTAMVNNQVEGDWQTNPPPAEFDLFVHYLDIYSEIA